MGLPACFLRVSGAPRTGSNNGRNRGGSRMPSRLPGCLELHINGGSPLREVRHAINFLKDLKAVVQHDWSLGLLVEGEGKRRLEDILATQTLTWTSLEQKTLAASCPFPTVIIPLLQMCLSFDERFPHLPRQTNTLYAIVCIPDLFGKIVSLFDRPEAAGRAEPRANSANVALRPLYGGPDRITTGGRPAGGPEASRSSSDRVRSRV